MRGMVELAVAAAGGLLAAVVAGFAGYWKGKRNGRVAAERAASRKAHEDATERKPPVEIGDRVNLGVKEFNEHHSGNRVAVCKKERFVIFVDDVPKGVKVGTVIDAEVTSFGREKNSAEASYVGR
jgi:predicted RNA-binding protein with TRAM domain